MGLFGRKMSKAAGEWAAIAMGCMVYADGTAGQGELEAAERQLETNPVLMHSVGLKKASQLFQETVEAIRQVPAAMLPTYEQKLAELAKKIKGQDERNFALATVIAVSMGDDALSQNEYAMLERFQKAVGANIPIPAPGQAHPAGYTPADAGGAAVPADEGGAATAGADDHRSPPCPSCGQATEWYEGYGAWCGACQRYAAIPGATGADSTAYAETREAAASSTDAESAAAAGSAPPCPRCGKTTRFYKDHGHWCADCKIYATRVKK